VDGTKRSSSRPAAASATPANATASTLAPVIGSVAWPLVGLDDVGEELAGALPLLPGLLEG
jgi:hypothetical protein